TIQPIPYAPSGLSIKSMSLQFRDKDVMQDSIKCFAQVQVDDISCSSLIHQHFFHPLIPTSPSPRAALNPLITQPVFVLGIALTHVQDLAVGLLELHEVCTGPPLKPVQVPLDGTSLPSSVSTAPHSL
ncbi:unnamed protein product, partial [Bubo scandiacus]